MLIITSERRGSCISPPRLERRRRKSCCTPNSEISILVLLRNNHAMLTPQLHPMYISRINQTPRSCHICKSSHRWPFYITLLHLFLLSCCILFCHFLAFFCLSECFLPHFLFMLLHHEHLICSTTPHPPTNQCLRSMLDHFCCLILI